MKKAILFSTLCLIYLNIYSLGIGKAKEKLYEAYLSGDNSLWIEVMEDLENSYYQNKNMITLHELVKSQYGYLGYLIDRNDLINAKKILPKTENNIEKLLDYNSDWADAHGLKAGVQGFKIILFPTQVIFHGPKGKDYLDKATSYNEISPSIIVEIANYKYHTPSLLGGDIDEAIKYYKHAISLFELTNQKEQNWQYLNTVVWLAISLDKKGKSMEAKLILNKLLEDEPDFYWVKNDLYPRILRNESISRSYFSLKN